MRVFAAILLATLGYAQAQDAIQKAIAEKIASLSANAIVTKCPAPSDGFSSDFDDDPYQLKTSACVRISGIKPKEFSQLTIKTFGKQFESASWFGGDPVFVGNWKSSRSLYPLVLVPDGKTAVLIVWPADASSDVRRTLAALSETLAARRPSAKEARAAGATAGAGYASFDDFERFVSTTRQPPYFGFKLNRQTLTVKLGERRAVFGGRSVELPGVSFRFRDVVYMPVGLLRILGCSAEVPVDETRQRDSVIITCIGGGQTAEDVLPLWTF